MHEQREGKQQARRGGRLGAARRGVGVPTFAEQAAVDDTLRARLRAAHERRFGSPPTGAELEVLVRQEFARLSARLRGLAAGTVASAASNVAEPRQATRDGDGLPEAPRRLSPDQQREAEAAFAYAQAQGIDSVFGAVRWFHDHRQAFRSAPLLPQCVDEFLCVKRGEGCAPVTLRGYESKLERFGAAFAKRRPAEVLPAELGQWIVDRSAHPRTRLDWWQTLQTFFAWCERVRIVVRNPIPLALDKPKPPRGSQLVLTPVETRRLLRLARQSDQLGFWVLALFGGLRTEEIRRLQRCRDRWGLVRIRSGVIDLPAEIVKTHSRRVPMSPVLKEWLAVVRDRQLPFFPPSHFRKCRELRNRVLEARSAPLEERHRQAELGYRAPIWAFNIARRSFIAYSLALPGASYARVAEMVGNSEPILREHYHRSVSRTDAERFFRLGPATL